MKMEYSISTGNYDFAHPDKKTVYIRAQITGASISINVVHLNLPIEKEAYLRGAFNENPITAIRDAIAEHHRHVIYSSRMEAEKAFAKFTEEHEDELMLSYYQDELVQVNRRIAMLIEKKAQIENGIRVYSESLSVIPEQTKKGTQ